MSVSTLSKLPNDIGSLILSSYVSGIEWQLISKQSLQAWCRSGLYAQPNAQRLFTPRSFMLSKTGKSPLTSPISVQIPLDNWPELFRTYQKVNALLRNIRTELAHQQFILMDRSPIPITRNFSHQELVRMSTQIIEARDKYLITFAKWLVDNSQSARAKLTNLTSADAISKGFQGLSIQDLTYDPSTTPFNQDNSSIAAPLEILDLDAPSAILIDALKHAVRYNHIVFVKAFVNERKAPHTALQRLVENPSSYLKPETIRTILSSSYFLTEAQLDRAFSSFLRCLANLPSISSKDFPSIITILNLFLEHHSLSTYGVASLTHFMIPLGKLLNTNQLHQFLSDLLKSPKMSVWCLEESLERVAPSTIPWESRWGALELLLQHRTISSQSIERAISDVLITARRDGRPSQESIAVVQFLLNKLDTPISSYVHMMLSLDHARPSQDTFDQIEALIHKHQIPPPALAQRVEESKTHNTAPKFLRTLRAILDRPATDGSILWRCFVAILGPWLLQSYDPYCAALKMIASHPNASEMPLAIRIMIVFERTWALITFPFHKIFTLLFGEKVSQVLVSFLFLPITLLRVLHAVILKKIAS